jgi:hypothetical protein
VHRPVRLERLLVRLGSLARLLERRVRLVHLGHLLVRLVRRRVLQERPRVQRELSAREAWSAARSASEPRPERCSPACA